MATNILAIPQIAEPLNFRTQTNAAWIDGFAILVAGQAAGYPAAGNAGSGVVAIATVAPQSAIGSHTVRIVDTMPGITRFTVATPTNEVSGIGTLGVPCSAGGVTFTLSAAPGGPALQVGDSFTLSVIGVPLDLTGIAFDMALRTEPGSDVVALLASTRSTPLFPTPTLLAGGSGGQIALRVPAQANSGPAMSRLRPRTYAYDIIASADGYQVLVRYGTVEHVQGSTFPVV